MSSAAATASNRRPQEEAGGALMPDVIILSTIASGFEASRPFVVPIIAPQKLAAPDRPVLAPAEPVEHDAEHRRGAARAGVLGQTGGEGGMVVLHLDQRQTPCLDAP